MRLIIAAVLSASLTTAPLVAAGRPGAVRAAGQATGALAGTAQSAQGQTLANFIVRVRNLTNGNIAGSTTSSAAGQFSFAGLAPGNYMIEVVNAAGQVVGASASVAVAAGATVSVTVTASAVATLGALGTGAGVTAAAAGSVGAASAGVSTALVVTTAAAAAGIAGAVAVATTASGTK